MRGYIRSASLLRLDYLPAPAYAIPPDISPSNHSNGVGSVV